MKFTRRGFLASAAAATGIAVTPLAPARAAAKYTRYNATSPQGQAMLESYAIAIDKMLKLPPDHPHNWFRNAFVHLMDCPHGNWWFYVWHRGYLGYFEQTVRKLSGNPAFAFPYWDWTQLPQVPDTMFDGPLTPVDDAYRPYTKDLDTFTAYMKPAMQAYWDSLSRAQRLQLDARGFVDFDQLWNAVTGYDPNTGKIDPGNQAFAATDRARYLTRDNPRLDPKTAEDCSPRVVLSGLMPVQYYDPNVAASFTSTRTQSHNEMPNAGTQFSVLEGFPHNKVHNYTGGVGPWDPGPYGNMTNFLSPVDPVFFLHHSNMDRLWDVWTRKQQRLGLPILPTDPPTLDAFLQQRFLFFVRADGTYVTDGKAGDYVDTDRFEYDYEPGFPEVGAAALAAVEAGQPVRGTVAGGVGAVEVSGGAGGSVIAAVTLTRPVGTGAAREFDVLVNAPEGVTQVGADSPYYAGTVSFFGPPRHHMAMNATFAVPLPQRLEALAALQGTNASASAKLEIRLAPTTETSAPAPAVRAVSVQTL